VRPGTCAAIARLQHVPREQETHKDKDALPSHVAEAVDAIAQIHRAHHDKASLLDRFVDRATTIVGRPASLAVIALLVGLWIAVSAEAPRWGLGFFDPYPYPLLDLVMTIAGISIATLILASQKRDGRLGLLREQMTLELALLSEHKISKLIQLQEEFRRDSPNVHDRHDPEANEMAEKPDHASVLTIIDQIANMDTGKAPAKEPAPDLRDS
jgi:uncharacterized membrane protein